MAPKPQFPARGQKSPNFWDDDLKAYVDFGASLQVVNAGTHVLDDSMGEGELVGYRVKGDSTFTGEGGEIEVEAGVYVFERTATGWDAYVVAAGTPLAEGGSGGGDVTDPPTQPGAITVDPTADGFNISWVASTVAAGYQAEIDGSGVLIDKGTSLSHAYHGLQPSSTHSGRVRAYNSLGEKSAWRTWGPSDVDAMAFDDLIMTYDPQIYLRWSESTFESIGSTPGSWITNHYGSTGGPSFDGDALAPGDEGSAKFTVGKSYKMTDQPYPDYFRDAAAVTIVALVHSVTAGMSIQIPGVGVCGASLGTFNEFMTPGSTHLITWTSGAGAVGQQWRDGVIANTDNFQWNFGFDNTANGDRGVYFFGNQFGAGANGEIHVGHVAFIFGDAVLTEEQIKGLAVAAGTWGNPR